MTDFICRQYVLFSDLYSNDRGSHGRRTIREQLAAILRRFCENAIKQTSNKTPEASGNTKTQRLQTAAFLLITVFRPP